MTSIAPAGEGETGHSTALSAPETADDRIAAWLDRLQAYRARLQDEPQFNPVRQLAFDLSRELESGRLAIDGLTAASKELCDRALLRRAANLRAYLGDLDPHRTGQRIRSFVRKAAHDGDRLLPFETFAARWNAPRHAAVLTAHPTFAMSERAQEVLVRMVKAGSDIAEAGADDDLKTLTHAPRSDIDLVTEHGRAQTALGHAQDALARIDRIILDVARELYPERWRDLCPRAVELASWVGYDMEGRTDIAWTDSIRLRLDEKRRQLERNFDAVDAALASLDQAEPARSALNSLAALLREDIRTVNEQIVVFSGDLSDPARLSGAANAVTQGHGSTDHAPSAGPMLKFVDKAIVEASGEEVSRAMCSLRAQIANSGLGTARVHFRLNAMQLHNAIRKPLKLDSGESMAGRLVLARLDRLVMKAGPQSVNFASLAVERTSAIRIFIAMAQILKHIDGETPIRLLISECETPFDVLSALYFARVFGIEDRLDISPLFETESGLDHGARTIETLLGTKSFRAHIARRKRLCVETGFSDSGRLFGQVPAALAIERFHGRLAEMLSHHRGLEDVTIVVFDTHGESMGRGGHPASLQDRFTYIMSPWARAAFRDRGFDLVHESSFQGGDGYVFFGSGDLAFATLAGMLLADEGSASPETDSFYENRELGHDVFEQVKGYQERLFEDPNYHAALGAFGSGLLVKAGSRKSKRQHETGRALHVAPREMHAVRHNALLQQFGYLITVVGGLGSTVWREREAFADMYARSARLRELISLVARAKELCSIKTLVAYAGLFDDAYWVTRPYDDLEPQIKDAALHLAKLLRGDPRHERMMNLASFLRDDAVHLHDVFMDLGLEDLPSWRSGRKELDLLHAIRIALIQHIFLLAARMPRFSARHDISRDDIIRLILSLRVEEAADMLREAYPQSAPKADDYDMAEPATYTGQATSDYAEINRTLIDPIVSAHAAILEIGAGISHYFGAHG